MLNCDDAHEAMIARPERTASDVRTTADNLFHKADLLIFTVHVHHSNVIGVPEAYLIERNDEMK